MVPLPGIYSPPQLSGFCMSHLSPFECYLSGDAPFDHPVPFPSRTFCPLPCFILGTYCRILYSLLTIFHLSPSPPIQKECSRKPELYSSCSLLWLWQLEQSPAHSRCSINTCQGTERRCQGTRAPILGSALWPVSHQNIDVPAIQLFLDFTYLAEIRE